MGVNKGEPFARGDIYVDYPFEDVMFRWDHLERKAYRKFYGKAETGPIPHDNRLYNEALCFGDEISREAYLAGKRHSGMRNT